MKNRAKLENDVRQLREYYHESVRLGLSGTMLRQIKENWGIARDTLNRFDAKISDRPSIIYTAQGNRAQPKREWSNSLGRNLRVGE